MTDPGRDHAVAGDAISGYCPGDRHMIGPGGAVVAGQKAPDKARTVAAADLARRVTNPFAFALVGIEEALAVEMRTRRPVIIDAIEKGRNEYRQQQ